MGRVFTYDEIAANAVPQHEDFERAKQTFLDLGEQGVADGYIEGAFIFGSITRGTQNPMSDFDGLVAIADTEPQTLRDARTFVRNVQEAGQNKIPTGIIVRSKTDLEQGRHEMDRFFGYHLGSNERIVLGGDPADYISYPEDTAEEILRRYIHTKSRRMLNTCTGSTPEEAAEGKGLQRLLELPVAIGRKTLQAIGETGQVDDAAPAGANKPLVLASMSTLMEECGLSEDFDRLATLNGNYLKLLERTLAGQISRKEYNESLGYIHDELPTAVRWLAGVEDEVLPRLAPYSVAQ